jgi:membrane fusion protein
MSVLFRKEVYRQRQRRLSGEIRIARPPTFVWLAWLIAIFVVLSSIVLVSSDFPRKETVRGYIEPVAGVIRLRNPSPGLVTEVFVQESQSVQLGQPLIQISNEQFLPEGLSVSQELVDELESRQSRIQRQIQGERHNYRVVLQNINDRLLNVQARMEHSEQQMLLLERRLELNRLILSQWDSVRQQGHISEIEIIRQQDLLLDLEHEYETAKLNRSILSDQRIELERNREQAPLQFQSDLDNHFSRIEDTAEEIRRAKLEQHSELRAPVSGRVSGLLVTRGQYVTPDQTLMHINSSGGPLQATLHVPSSSIGTIEEGQVVRMRFVAFPYQRFGVHEGVVTQVGKSALFPSELAVDRELQGPAYRVIVGLSSNSIEAYGRTFQLRPGMELDADIVIEERSLIEWLFDPIFMIQRKL